MINMMIIVGIIMGSLNSVDTEDITIQIQDLDNVRYAAFKHCTPISASWHTRTNP